MHSRFCPRRLSLILVSVLAVLCRSAVMLADQAQQVTTAPAAVDHADRRERKASPDCAAGPNLLFNGTFDNGIWYERFRGWSPSGWYQWFTCGGHAPEHAVGKDIPHSGKEYVRIHMWAHAWRGGLLQNVRGVEPCRWYRLTAYGWFAKTADDPRPRERVGIEPCGKLAQQFAADVTRHPAPPYNECVGDDPKTPEVDWPDLPETTVWSAYQDYERWGRFEVYAEARSDTVTAILYCDPRQRPAEQPIYEMNWDTVALREIPWPNPRLVGEGEQLKADARFENLVVNVQRTARTAQITWKTKFAAGTSQALYRFLPSEASRDAAGQPVSRIRSSDYPHHGPVIYERSQTTHWVEISDLMIPQDAGRLEVVVLSRTLVDGRCVTYASKPQTCNLPAE